MKYGSTDLLSRRKVNSQYQTLTNLKIHENTELHDNSNSESVFKKPPTVRNYKINDEKVLTNLAYKTTNKFYDKNYQGTLLGSKPNLPKPKKAKQISVKDWMKEERIPSLTTNLSVPESMLTRIKTRATTSQIVGGRSASYDIRAHDTISLMNLKQQQISPPGSRMTASRKPTPYETYKIDKRKKRYIFASQMIPSKNKVVSSHASVISEATTKCKYVTL